MKIIKIENYIITENDYIPEEIILSDEEYRVYKILRVSDATWTGCVCSSFRDEQDKKIATELAKEIIKEHRK
jgi:hypothetical protein